MGLSMSEKASVTKEMGARYRKATRRDKGAMLDELVALTGWTRRHARRRMQAADTLVPRPPRPKRRPARRRYDDHVVTEIVRLWKMMGGPCGKRLAPFTGELIAALERHGEFTATGEVRARLVAMSAATIDRATAAERKRLQVRGRHGTKPGSMLKHQIPIRTFSEWDDARPGFVELDLVSHDGGSAAGEFCQTLDLTDVASGWTVMRAVPNKAQKHVHVALLHLRRALPFPLRGIDSDNGGEFINTHLFTWCERNHVTFTRSRPGRKNDNCFVEQKNWTHVRQQVGYARFDTPRALATLNELYAVLGDWVNFFGPQQRLVTKTRDGSRVKRTYDLARTPYRRLLDSPHLSPQAKAALRRRYEAANPAELSREIARLQRALRKVASRPPTARPIPQKQRPEHFGKGIAMAATVRGPRPQAPRPARSRGREVRGSTGHASRTSSVRQRREPSRTS